MGSFHRGSWLLYINGIHVPAQQVVVQYGVMAPPEADITLAPDKELIRLGSEDRVQVAVFYLDDVQTKNEGRKPDYRLLFEGEVTAWGYENTPAGRSIQLKAVNHAAIFSQMFTFFMTNVEGLAAGFFAPGDQVLSAVHGPLFPATLFYQGLTRSGSVDFIKRPYDFIENIFKALFGQVEFSKFNSTVAAHFFARWSRRTNFINRWAPSPLLEGVDTNNALDGVFPILKALRETEGVSALINKSTEIASSGSMWNLLVEIFRLMYYEFTLLPNMPLTNYDLTTGRLVPGDPQIANETPELKAARAALVAAVGARDALLQTGGGTSDQDAQLAVLTSAVDTAEESVRAALEASKATTRGRGPADPTKPLRLLNYVTKPQLHYCVPPRCNIMFPSMITSYSYQENFAAQPTRIYINDDMRDTALSGGQSPTTIAQGIMRVGFPPRVQQATDASQANLQISGKNFLLYPEEFYKGPVVARAGTPNWFYILSQSLSSAAAARVTAASASEEEATKTRDQTLRSLYQLYAEYEFNKERGATRSGGVTLKFNPYIAPGFPGVVFDREDTNAHIFCYVTSATHTLSSNSMSTAIGYSHAQPFQEFFTSLVEQRNGFKGRVSLEPDIVVQTKKALVAAQAALQTVLATANNTSSGDVEAAQTLVDKLAAELDVLQGAGVQQKQRDLAAAQAALDRTLRESDGRSGGSITAAQQQVADKTLELDRASRAVSAPDSAPFNPIPDIRVRFQNIANAAEYYAALFQRGQEYAGRPAAFDWTSDIGVLNPADPALEPAPISLIEGDTVSVTLDNGEVVTRKIVSTNAVQSGVVGYAPRDKLRVLAEDSALASQYIARPICTLDEFIDFHGDLGVKVGPIEEDSGSTYFIQILDFITGPGEEPTEDADGNRTPALLNDTRDDWTSRLLAYRQKVLSKKTNHRA